MLSAQRRFGLPETGRVDAQTWLQIYDQYAGIESTSLRDAEVFPSQVPQTQNTVQTSAIAVMSPNTRRQRTNAAPVGRNGSGSTAQTTTMRQFPGKDLSIGMQDPVRQEVVR